MTAALETAEPELGVGPRGGDVDGRKEGGGWRREQGGGGGGGRHCLVT